APGVVEHAAVELAQCGLGELKKLGAAARGEEPGGGFKDVEALVFIELLAGGEAGEELLLLLHREGCAVLVGLEDAAGAAHERFSRRRRVSSVMSSSTFPAAWS